MESHDVTTMKKNSHLKNYSIDEAFEASLKYFKGDELAARVWVNKYALKDSYGNLFELTPDDLHHRLSSEIARIEKKYPNPLSETELLKMFERIKFVVPEGGPMIGIGNEIRTGSLSNCFVVGNGADSYGGNMMVD